MEQFKNDFWLRTVKYISAILNGFATWGVFYGVFKGDKPDIWYITLYAIINTLSSIALIDGFFLLALSKIESLYLNAYQKIPWTTVSIFLMISTLYIGYIDENKNILSFAPRLGLVSLTLVYVMMWMSQFYSEYFSREAIEQRLRDKQVVKRRRMHFNQWKNAMKELKDDIKQVEKEREMTRLNIVERIAPVIVEPARQKQLQEPAELCFVVDKEIPEDAIEVEDGVFMNVDGTFCWQTLDGDVVISTQSGSPYTSLSGAKRARTRAINSGAA